MERDGSDQQRSWVDEAAALLRMVAGTDLEQLEIEHDGARITVRREPRGAPRDTAGSVTPAPDEPVPRTFVVTSPKVGVFRRTTGGKDGPPVEEGDDLTAGQVVGAVEAMRNLDPVQVDRSGVVEQVLVQDGQAVEYGQPLIVVRPD